MIHILYIGMDTVDYGVNSRSHEVYVAETLARLGHNVIGVFERMPNFQDGEKRILHEKLQEMRNL